MTKTPNTETTAETPAAPKSKPKAKRPTPKLPASFAAKPEPATIANVALVPLALIDTLPQVRTTFDDTSLSELANDIQARGLLQPILLNPNGDRYTVIAGERRLRAFRLLNRAAIPALLTKASQDETTLMQLAENIQREELTTSDTATAVRKLFDHLGSSKAVAEATRKSKAWVSKHLAITCEGFAWQARRLIEDGTTDDLELVGVVNQAAKISYNTGNILADAIRKESLNRTQARARLKEIKAAADADEAEKIARQAEYKEQVKAVAEQKKNAPLDGKRVCWRIGDDIEDNEFPTPGAVLAHMDKRTRLAAEEHLTRQHTAGVEEMGDAFPAILAHHSSNANCLEMAAFIRGVRGDPFDLLQILTDCWNASPENAERKVTA